MNEIQMRNEYEQSIAMAKELITDMEYKLSHQQLLLLRYLIKQIKPEDKEDTIYRIKIRDFCLLTGSDAGGSQYRNIKKTFYAIDNQTKWIETQEDVIRIKWFNRLKIKKESGTIEYSFNDGIAPFLFGLIKSGKSHLLYSFEEIVVFENKYSVRLFEYIKYHYNMGHQFNTIFIKELMPLLGNTNYKRFSDFNANVLKKAVKEINEKSYIYLTYKGNKAGDSKAFTSITFTINKIDSIKDKEEFFKRDANIRAATNNELPF